jgi:proline iminopeptidase
MTERRHAITDPIDEGMLDVGDGHSIHWEVAGDPDGKPAVLLHGGPGSGSSPRTRQMFDPSRYLIVQFDQRGCGRSTPSASQPEVDLSANTTPALVADIERLREHLGIDRWLVWGGSWGTTLGLAYAEAYPGSVTELVLASIVTTSADEVLWLTRAMGRVFPERWRAFVEALPPHQRDGNLALAYNRRLMDPDPLVHEPAALAWCEWEDAHVSIAMGSGPGLRDEDPAFRLTFARLVTHYWGNAGFLEDGQLMRDAERIAHIPTFMTHGRRDISGPVDVPYALAQALPGAELFISETDGHGGPHMTDWMTSVLDRLATGRTA